MIIGIDSGDKMNYTGVVSESEFDIFQLYSEIEKFMKNENINLHFDGVFKKFTSNLPSTI